MPKSALPEHLKDVENHFPDDKQFGDKHWWARLYTWYNKKTKTWFAFSYRCTEWWARWRKYPIVLFAIRGKGRFRMEDDKMEIVQWTESNSDVWINYLGVENYLSRIQYYTRWHFAVQWPLMFSAHFYPKAEDVPKFGEPVPDLDGKVWFFYWNHFDRDLIYWMVTSFFLGRVWK